MFLCEDDEGLRDYPEDLIRRFSRVADILAIGAIRAAVALKQSRELQAGLEAEIASETDLSEAA